MRAAVVINPQDKTCNQYGHDVYYRDDIELGELEELLDDPDRWLHSKHPVNARGVKTLAGVTLVFHHNLDVPHGHCILSGIPASGALFVETNFIVEDAPKELLAFHTEWIERSKIVVTFLENTDLAFAHLEMPDKPRPSVVIGELLRHPGVLPGALSGLPVFTSFATPTGKRSRLWKAPPGFVMFKSTQEPTLVFGLGTSTSGRCLSAIGTHDQREGIPPKKDGSLGVPTVITIGSLTSTPWENPPGN